MRSTIFLIVLKIILLSLIGCTSETGEANTTRITYGLTLIPSGIDPHIHSSSELGIVLRQVYDTLVYRHPDTMEFVPGLAERWEVSSDGLVYTFYLRQDVTFHDNTPFNAEAVGENLDRIVDPSTASQRAASMLGPYQGYEIVAPYVIRLILTEPYAPLLDSLSQVYLSIASPSALNEYSLNRYQFHQVGTGPYRFVEYLPGDRIVIERNRSYSWGPNFYTRGPDSENIIDEVIFRFYVDESTRRTVLENGEAQIMGEILPVDARDLAANNRFQILATPIPGQPAQYLFNTQRYPTDILAVRQALLISIDRQAITDTIFQGFSPVAWGPLSSSTQFYSSRMVDTSNFDLSAAREILATAGFDDSDGDGFLDNSDGPLEIVVIVPNWGLMPQVSQVLQEQWTQLGIQVRLEPVPGFNALLDRVTNQPYNLVSFNTPGIDPALINSYFLTDGSRNWMNYSNAQLDRTLQVAVATLDPVIRRDLYRQVQEFVMNEALILPIREYVNLNAVSNTLSGLRFDAYGWFPILNDVTIVQ